MKLFSHIASLSIAKSLWHGECFSRTNRMNMTLGFRNQHHARNVFIPATMWLIIVWCIFTTLQYRYQMYSVLGHSIHVKKRSSCMRRWGWGVGGCGVPLVLAFMHRRQTGWISQGFIYSLVSRTNYHSSYQAPTSRSLMGCQFLMWRALRYWRVDGPNI